MKRVLLSWSSGKDSAWTLHTLRQQADLELVGLLTTFNHAFDRVAMHAVREGVTHMAFGDLFLEDVRDYRIRQLKGTGIEPLFPIWSSKDATPELAHRMQKSGIRAIITCVDPKQLDPSFVGGEFDAALLEDLPSRVDPCGEKGEFHTFCYAGPMFETRIEVVHGERVEREGFHFIDLVPGASTGVASRK